MDLLNCWQPMDVYAQNEIPKARDSSTGNPGFSEIYHTSFYAGDWICLKPFGPSLNPIYALNVWNIYLHLPYIYSKCR